MTTTTGYRVDPDGVPIVDRDAIERRAERAILYAQPNYFDVEPSIAPLMVLTKRLVDDKRIAFYPNVDLGTSPEGKKYRGRFNVKTCEIYIDSSMAYGSERFNFTLAHELGHYTFHRGLQVAGEHSETDADLELQHVQGSDRRGWLEWQANTFAAAFLLPRRHVPNVVVAKQRDLDIVRNLGQIYLDRQATNVTAYEKILQALAQLFVVSRSCIHRRLIELNLLIDDREGDGRDDRGGGPTALRDLF